MRQILKYVISILFIGAVFGGAWWYFDRESRQPAEQVLVNRARPAEETAVPVQTEPVARGPLVLSVATSGQAFTRRQITVKAEVSGKVNAVAIREGAPVEAGAPAVSLDDTEYRLNAANAKADYKKALTKHRASVIEGKRLLQELENQKKSFELGLIPRYELEQMESRYNIYQTQNGTGTAGDWKLESGATQAELSVKQADLNIRRCRILAPIAGRVYDLKVVPGQMVGTGEELFSVVDLPSVKVEAAILEADLPRVRVGGQAELRFTARPDEVITGRVELLKPVVDEDKLTGTAIIAFDNRAGHILPGMHAEVTIETRTLADVISVPREAVLYRNERPLVFVVEGEMAKWRYVQVGESNAGRVQILDGVTPGEAVIVTGHFTLAHEARVQVRNR